MKYLMWLLNAAIFFALFAFALNNQGAVTLHLFFGARWNAPLVLVLLCTLLVGVVLGVMVMLPLWIRARRRRHGSTHSDLMALTPAAAPSPNKPANSLKPAVPDAVQTQF